MRAKTKREYQSPSKRRIDPTLESRRWVELIEEVQAGSPNHLKLIHVTDREGDDYALLSRLVDKGIRFVIRTKYNRRIKDQFHKLLFDSLREADIVCEREVHIAARKVSSLPAQAKRHPARAKESPRKYGCAPELPSSFYSYRMQTL